MKRFAIYARYSSDQQNAASIEDQMRTCRQYVERTGGIALATYGDAAVSGAHSAARPQYQALLRDAEAGMFDCILAEDMDRYARDTEESARLLKRMAFRNIEVHTVHGKVDKINGTLKGLMGDLFLEQLAEKTKRGMVGAFERGHVPSGLCYGYRTGSEPGQRVIHEAEAAIVRRIYEQFAAGLGADDICRRLNQEGVPTGRSGKLWRGSTLLGNPKRLNGLLNNPIYAGRVAFNRQRFIKDPATGKRQARPNPPSEWLWRDFPELQIVAPDLYKAAQAKRRGVVNRPRQANRPKHLLSGLIVCGVCGGPMVKQGRWFRCTTTRTGACSNGTGLPVAEIEERILVALQTILRAPEMREQFIKEHSAHLEAHWADIEREQRALERRQQDLDRKIARLVDAIASGTDLPSVRDRLRLLEAERTRLAAPAPRGSPAFSLSDMYSQSEAGTAQRRLDDILDGADAYYRGVAQLADLINGGSVEAYQAKDAIRACITRIEAYPGKGKDGKVLVRADGDLAGILGLAGSGTDLLSAGGCGGQI